MTEERPTVRLFVAADLTPGAEVMLSPDQAHYLFTVMRLGAGDHVALFNGRDGEWRVRLVPQGRRGGVALVETQTRPQDRLPDLWLLFAPIKRARIDLMAEKAAEMGAAAMRPVITRRTHVERVNMDRLRAHAIEAAEQCGLLTVPRLDAPIRLDRLLDDWPAARRLMFCDEAGGVPPAAVALAAEVNGASAPRSAPVSAPWAVLIGPEGGFDEAERARLRALPQALPVSLGPRILRADTAAVAALAIWQSLLGDWRE